jgi:hypothetical protein
MVLLLTADCQLLAAIPKEPTMLTTLPLKYRATASAYQCAVCPPDRVCAWSCVQGAGMEDIVMGAVLAAEGKLKTPAPIYNPAEANAAALWESFNPPDTATR